MTGAMKVAWERLGMARLKARKRAAAKKMATITEATKLATRESLDQRSLRRSNQTTKIQKRRHRSSVPKTNMQSGLG